jgi:minor extracellular serine protease Vpr
MFKKSLSVLLVALLVLGLAGTGFAANRPVDLPQDIPSRDALVRVIVQLNGKTVLSHERELVSQGRFTQLAVNNYAADLNKANETTIQSIKKTGIALEVENTFSYSFVGFSGTVPFNQVGKLAKQANVKGVFADEKVSLPEIYWTVPGTGAPYIWHLPEGVTGANMIVAVLDTGIYYPHPKLGGGFGPDYKVKGGWNFTDSGVPHDPIDDHYHGTHVAGIIAANGNATGDPDFMGVAPDASLYAVKVLGEDGRGWASWIVAGIEWAVNPPGDLPRADIINMSLGNSLVTTNYPTTIAANEAAEAGVIVVASAGNNGHLQPTAGSPGTGEKVITVGSSGIIAPPVIELSNGVVYNSEILTPDSAPMPDGQFYGVVYAGLGQTADFAQIDATGKIALISRGAIAFTTKVANAKAAGAVGAIIFNTEPGLINMAGNFTGLIPAFSISLDMGLEILQAMDADENLEIALDVMEHRELMSNFSSAGPNARYQLKPDITAPGDNVLSTMPAGYGWWAFLGGTSMAAPHVAGGAALLKELRPGLSVAEYKALLMNTAYLLYDQNDNKYPVTVKGSGQMDLMAAAKSRGLALPGSLSLRVDGAENVITVKNFSEDCITYTIEFVSGTLTAQYPATITVAPNTTAEFTITFDMNLAEGHHEGYILLTPTEPLQKDLAPFVVEEDYYDVLSIPVYHYEGDIPEFFVKDLEFPKVIFEGDDIDITFTLLRDANWVAVVIYDQDADFVNIPAEAPFGLPAGTWIMYNTYLYDLAPGNYFLRLFVLDLDGNLYDLWEVLEVVEAPDVGIYVPPYVDTDTVKIQGHNFNEVLVFINGNAVTDFDEDSWEYYLPVAVGENSVEIQLLSPKGISRTETHKVTRIADKPVYSIEDLLNDMPFTNKTSAFVYDFLPPGAVVTVSLNGGPGKKYIANEKGIVAYTLEGLKPGENTIRVTENFFNIIYTYEYQIYRMYVERLYGANRFATANAIAAKGWEKADTVVLVRSDDFADSLVGVPLAVKLDAPILLTQTNLLTPATKAEIERLEAKEIIILGGTGAISQAVADELEGMGLDVTRIGGKNRYETAALIAEEVVGEDEVDVVFVVYGLNFPDGLAAAPMAARMGVPVLLANTNVLPQETAGFLTNHNVSETFVVGGEGVISKEVFDLLPGATRIAGNNRFVTAVEVAKMEDSDKIFIASGASFADALTLAALAAKNEGILLLVSRDSIHASVDEYLSERKVQHIIIAGGISVVSEAVAQELVKYLSGPAIIER